MFGVDPDALAEREVATRAPSIADGEGWFEAVNWVVAASAARDRYVMVTLGACYGGQAVGAYRALQRLNPMPYKLVAVEPEPENFEWVRATCGTTASIPTRSGCCSTPSATATMPVLFPVGSPGTGAQNCYCHQRGRLARLISRELSRRQHRRGAAKHAACTARPA